MRNYLANYFFYSRRERNGILILFFLILIMLVLPKIVPLQTETYDINVFAKAVTDFEKSIVNEPVFPDITLPVENSRLFILNPNSATYNDFVQLGLPPRVATTIVHYRERGGYFRKKEDLKKIYGLKSEDYMRIEAYIDIPETNQKFFENKNAQRDFKRELYGDMPEVKETKLFPFDPNSVGELELLTLGVEKNVVKNIIKYREKGGHFYKKEDLKKIYGFSEIDFLRLINYIQINENQNDTHKYFSSNKQANTEGGSKTEQSLIIDVNKASQSEWLQLRGIGVTFAKRIYEQREKLGGFASLEQLKETYGLPDSVYYHIIPFLKISPITRKLHINKADIEALTHPYVSRKQAEVLMRYRINHGDFKNIDDLKKTGVFDDKNIEKLKPYINFN
jgi:competence protein ComEA